MVVGAPLYRGRDGGVLRGFYRGGNGVQTRPRKDKAPPGGYSKRRGRLLHTLEGAVPVPVCPSVNCGPGFAQRAKPRAPDQKL